MVLLHSMEPGFKGPATDKVCFCPWGVPCAAGLLYHSNYMFTVLSVIFDRASYVVQHMH